MPIEHINKTDTLNEGREKLNAAIDGANAADVTSQEADTKATQALANSESTQTQLDTIVIDGDSSVEAAQARVDEKGVPHPTLKARIDDGLNSVNQQLAQIVYDIKSYGAIGDGVTDDTQAIQELYNSLSGGDTLYIPAGTFLISNLVFDRDDVFIRSHGILKQSTLATGVAVTIGLESERRYNIVTEGLLRVERNPDWSKDTTGIKLINLYNCDMKLMIVGFQKGLHLHADGTGTVYNNITFTRMYNNMISNHYTVSNNGWVNENKFYGGQFGWSSGLASRLEGESISQMINRLGNIHVNITDTTMNQNVYFSPSFEGFGGTFIKCVGKSNVFYAPRMEGDVLKVHFLLDAYYNKVDAPYLRYEEERFIDEGNRKNIILTRDIYLTSDVDQTGNSFKAHGALTKNADSEVESIFDAMSNGASNKLYTGRNPLGEITYYVDGNGNLTSERTITSKQGTVAQHTVGDNFTALQVKNSTGANVLGFDGTGLAIGVLKLPKVTSLPAASISSRGRILRVEGGAGTADVLYICRKTASDSYEWKQLDI